ncbi:MAG TPA: YraN family protein, partial [Peptococcaceae bacterium]|nr:YraN family protein [Peptococcaceae bacterium]
FTPRQREQLALRIKEAAVAWSVKGASVEEINAINILRATHLAMRRALASLKVSPDWVLVDGPHPLPELAIPQTPLVKGDAASACIAAASILAKVTRDRIMDMLDEQYPVYGFRRHRGYPTPEHIAALYQYGPSPVHRLAFSPVRDLLAPGARADGRRQTGRAGEEAAAAYLLTQGYKIVCRNYRCPEGELDLVALDGDILVFVEVKARRGTAFGLPQESVVRRKQARIRRLARRFLSEKGVRAAAYRFDVIAVTWGPGREPHIEHIRNAF